MKDRIYKKRTSILIDILHISSNLQHNEAFQTEKPEDPDSEQKSYFKPNYKQSRKK